MTCKTVKIGNTAAIVCQRGRRKTPKCKNCGQRPGTLLCDYPDAKHDSGTCDRRLCRICAVAVGPDLDYCPEHSV